MIKRTHHRLFQEFIWKILSKNIIFGRHYFLFSIIMNSNYLLFKILDPYDKFKNISVLDDILEYYGNFHFWTPRNEFTDHLRYILIFRMFILMNCILCSDVQTIEQDWTCWIANKVEKRSLILAKLMTATQGLQTIR